MARGCRNFNKLLIMLATADGLFIVISIVESVAFIAQFSDPDELEPLSYRLSYPYFLHPMRYSAKGGGGEARRNFKYVLVCTGGKWKEN